LAQFLNTGMVDIEADRVKAAGGEGHRNRQADIPKADNGDLEGQKVVFAHVNSGVGPQGTEGGKTVAGAVRSVLPARRAFTHSICRSLQTSGGILHSGQAAILRLDYSAASG
jgi:hypothetical protein